MKQPNFLEELNQGAEKEEEHDRQPVICKTASEIETICQHDPCRERYV